MPIEMPIEHATETEKKIEWKNFRVAVFSASSNSDAYSIENSDTVGHVLGSHGLDAVNGGYAVGGMGAMAKGFVRACKEAHLEDEEIKKHLTGVVMSAVAGGDQLKKERGVIPAASFVEADNLPERAGGIINNADAYIVTEGGFGTFLESGFAVQHEWAREKDSNNLHHPIIIIDNQNLILKTIALWEKEKPGSMSTMGSDVYILSGARADGPVPNSAMATLKNDPYMKEELELLLDYYQLKSLSSLTDTQQEKMKALEQELFSPTSSHRTMTLKECLAIEREHPYVE